jgi:hypothetical protein
MRLARPSHPGQYADIKVVPGLGVDLLYLIQTGSAVVRPMAASASQTSIRVVQFDGTKFATPVTVTLP